MTRRRLPRVPHPLGVAGLVLPLLALSCSPQSPQTGSQTNWFRSCNAVSDCDGLDCVCGTCTLACKSASECGEASDASCLTTAEVSVNALCDGAADARSICLATCSSDEDCAGELRCSIGVCVPPERAAPKVSLDLDTRHQTLLGFGSSLAYGEDEIAARPDKSALFDAMFEASGLDVVRLTNRYEPGAEDRLTTTAEIIAAARERIEPAPLLFMTSGSPPASLKANGSRRCAGDPDTCTLVALEDGSFDYPGFAAFWRSSVDAYEAAAITLDYISIQNNPNWVPSESDPNDACHFLPKEGDEVVTVAGDEVTVRYPGYAEALEAVRAAIADLPALPRLIGPETSDLAALEDYAASFGTETITAIACHLYGSDAQAVDVAVLERANRVASDLGVPIFQTEMRADGLDTAIFVHHALIDLGATTYLQNDFVASSEGNPYALIHLTSDGFELQGPYHALAHYAVFTDPGWIRLEASLDSSNVLASAWLSPDEDALSIVLVNPGPQATYVELDLSQLRATFAESEVVRTVFDTNDAFVSLGALPESEAIELPPGSVVTVALLE